MHNTTLDLSYRRNAYIGWCLFDFANSIPAVIGGVYFSKWFVEDIGAGYVNLNLLFFASSLIIVITGKWFGDKIDRQGYSKWIVLSSILAVLTTFLIYLNTQFTPKNLLVVFSFILYTLFIINYQLSRICHNVYLRRTIPQNEQAKLSGYGAASNWAGSIIGLVITIPIVINNPGVSGRENTFLLAAVMYSFLAPAALLLMLRKLQERIDSPIPNDLGFGEWRRIISKFGITLLVYFLLFEVMATVQRNLPPYLSSVFEMNDEIQSYAFLIVLVLAFSGGLIAAYRVHFENSRSWTLFSSAILALAILLITFDFQPFLWSGFVLAGLAYGILESAIRINFMKNFTGQDAGKHFGVMAVIERSSGILGPLMWIIPSYIFINERDENIGSMVLMLILTIGAVIIFVIGKREK